MATQEQIQDFISNYIATGNGVQSIISAGITSNPRSASVIASKLLSKYGSSLQVSNRVSNRSRTRKEVSEAAVDETRKVISTAVISAAEELKDKILSKKEVLIKLSTLAETSGREQVKALELLGKFHALFTDRLEVQPVRRTVVIDEIGNKIYESGPAPDLQTAQVPELNVQ